MSNEPNKIIYSMVGVSKHHDKKAVLKDIYLSFLRRENKALGLNGSSKFPSAFSPWTKFTGETVSLLHRGLERNPDRRCKNRPRSGGRGQKETVDR